MTLSRRTLLKSLTVVAASGLLGVVAVRQWGDRLWVGLDAQRTQLLEPTLMAAPTGTLTEQTIQVLLAAAEALVGTPIEPRHYAVYFRWRAENLPGYHALYEQFADTLERSAQRRVKTAFLHCEPVDQRAILEKAFQVTERHQGWLRSLRTGLLEKEWLLFEEYIVREIFVLFFRTDAWVALGYEAWPGTARGFDRYQVAPVV